MKIVGIIQARLDSTRLPGKVLLDLAGRPLLQHVIERVRAVEGIDEVVVATTNRPEDDAVASFVESMGVACFRGHPTDVLDRFHCAASLYNADAVTRHTADCPLLAPELVSEVVKVFREGGYDYVSNVLRPSYPDGVDVETFSFEALEAAWREAALASEREHVTPFLVNHPERFRQFNVGQSEDLSGWRWTVDEPRDLEFVRAVLQSLNDHPATYDEIVKLLKARPELLEINGGIRRNEGYEKSLAAERTGAGQRLYEHAKQRIPGGTQLLSKRPEMFLPGQWPSYYSRASGCEVWDLDGRRFLDFSISSVGACPLGYADPDVNEAVTHAVANGSICTLNPPEEIELADVLCELHPWAEMARFPRTGGEAMAVAVRIARAATGRDVVAFCGYHGWSDWYLAANLSEDKALDGHLLPGLAPAGVPRGLTGTALPFRYNHIEDLREIIAKHGDRLAAIVTEPIRAKPPEEGFFAGVQQLAKDTGALVIADEITMGFRLRCGGAHELFGLQPDIAIFAKGMSNGFPMAAVIGRAEIMQAAQATFISSSYWTDRIGPVAALACIAKLRANDIPAKLAVTGRRIREGWAGISQRIGLPLAIDGVDPLPSFTIDCNDPLAAKTLFVQEMLDRNFLATGAVFVTAAHTEEKVADYLVACEAAFAAVREALDAGAVKKNLRGPVAHGGFHRLA
ncbi:MAG: aminotransferase class III-fold pyridoxal phosphate-dependent enzyme [Chthoniobacterales bacterium]